MPSYPALSPVTLTPGAQCSLVNDATTDVGVTTTIQVIVANISPTPPTLMLSNTTNQAASVQVAFADANANYTPLSYVPLSTNAGAISVAAGASVYFACSFPFVRCTFQVAPTSGSLVVLR